MEKAQEKSENYDVPTNVTIYGKYVHTCHNNQRSWKIIQKILQKRQHIEDKYVYYLYLVPLDVICGIQHH